MKYLMVIEKGEDALWAYFPDVPGCVTAGATLDEVLHNAVDALDLHFQDDETIPAARSLREIVNDPEIQLNGSEVLTWLDYEHHAHAPA